MNQKTVFMFSGHGSHYFHMGRELFEQQTNFRRHLLNLDEMVRALANLSIVDVLYDPKRTRSETFDQTVWSHPAIFMVEYALAKTLIDKGIHPDLVLGVSAGTLAAVAIAGCLDPADALRIALRQAEAFEHLCPKGGMLAVAEDGERLARNEYFRGKVEVAAFNFEASAVISAPHDALGEIEAFLKQQNVICQKLAVSRAFHSKWIDGAKDACRQVLAQTRLRPQQCPVVCCAAGTMLGDLTQEHMWRVIREPIRFKETISALDRRHNFRYIDIGPSGTLATLLKYCLPQRGGADIFPIMSPFGSDMRNLLRLVH